LTHARTLHYTQFTTPAGAFSVAVDSEGAVAGAAFGGPDALGFRVGGAALVCDDGKASAARAQVEAWFRGERRDFTVPLSPVGTPFQRRVWGALRRIPFGRTLSYGDLARTVHSSPRAVGRANAANPICLLVPCHRVIGADGSLTGYAFGTETKKRLLDFEAA
jgi:methylated-DNA-[protein]-cysteine S-methyltransferase